MIGNKRLLMVLVLGFAILLAPVLIQAGEKKTFEPNITDDMSSHIKEKFNYKYGAIRLDNTFLFIPIGKKAEYTIFDNTDLCLTECYTIGGLTLYEDSKLFDNAKFLSMDKKDFKKETTIKSFKYYILDGYENITEQVVDTYRYEYEVNIHGDNMSSQIADTFKTVSREVEKWKEYKGETLPAGNYVWKIIGQKDKYQSVDFIPQINNIDFSEWVTWNSSFEVGLVAVWNLNESSGNAIDYYRGIYNGTPNGTISPVKGINDMARNFSHDIAGGFNNFNLGNYMQLGWTNYTFSAWINNSQPTAYNVFYSNVKSGDGYCGIQIQKKNNNNIQVLKYCTAGWVESTIAVPNNRYFHLAVTMKDNTTMNIYINGTFAGGFNMTSAPHFASNFLLGGDNGNVQGGDAGGSMDEVYIYNRTMSGAEVSQLYDSGTGTFYTKAEAPATPNLTVDFNTQYPATLNLTNFIGSGGVNITYNITSSVGINVSAVKLMYKSNDTASNVQFYQNGTAFSGYFADLFKDNVSNVFRFNLLDNQILSGVYNYGAVSMENSPHDQNVLTGNSDVLIVELYNISSSITYNFYEIMANSTGTIRSYYCNSSYNFASSILTNPNCILFYTVPANNPYSHTHTIYSSHQVLPFTINVSTGSVGTVKVTPTSYFVTRGNSVNFYTIPNTTRAGAFRNSTDLGANWINQTFTVDAHLHQIANTSSLWYYACVNDTSGNSNCTTPREASLGITNLPPTSPTITSPATNYTFNQTVPINYTASYSPNGYPIVRYNITLLNTDFSYNKTITANNTNLLSYSWYADTIGSYIISVTAIDNESQSSIGYSEIFSIIKQTPTFTFLLNGATENLTLIYPATLNVSATATNNTYVSLERNGANYSVNNSVNVILPIGNYTFKANVTGNEFYNSVATEYKFVEIISIGTITLNSPANATTFYYNQTTFNCSVSSVTPLKNLSIIVNNVFINSTSLEGGRNVLTDDLGALGSNTLEYGLVIKPEANGNITNIIKGSACTRTGCKLILNSTNAVLTTGTFVGNNCSVNYELTKGTVYRIIAYDTVGDKQIGETSGVTGVYPKEANNTIILGAWRGDISNIDTTYKFSIVGLDFTANTTDIEKVFVNNIGTSSNLWNCQACSLTGSCFTATAFNYYLNTVPPTVEVNYPTGNLSNVNLGDNINLSYNISSPSIDSCWFEYGGTNTTLNCSAKNYTFALGSSTSLKVYANDTIGNLAVNSSSWNFNLLINSVTYTASIVEGTANNIVANISLNSNLSAITSIVLSYNGTNSTPLVYSSGTNYLLISNLTAPSVNENNNLSFYYSFVVSGVTTVSQTYYQVITNINASTNCSVGYGFLNTINYEEDLLSPFNGTVEYTLNLLGLNGTIYTLNGSSTGYNITFCTNQNLTNQFIRYNLQLRYYDLAGLYFYETYNIQNSEVTNLPITVPLYYLNRSLGTQFKINYEDFYYIKYPSAVIQVQRQYLSTDSYNIVELPKIDSQGQAVASFNTNNIKYKIIVVNQGEVLDIFSDIFPVCQNLVLGTCELNLRGSQDVSTSTTGDFTYLLTKSNNSLTLTYVIPSGTPRTINFLTYQNSRFLSNITTCNSTLFSSGGTLVCPYNQTIGDSIISTQIIDSIGTTLYGTVLVSEDLGQFFLLNNFFIGFILVLSIALMFVSSAVVMVIGAGIGIIYLGMIFLLRGFDFVTVASGVAWLIVAIALAVYFIAKKEETT